MLLFRTVTILLSLNQFLTRYTSIIPCIFQLSTLSSYSRLFSLASSLSGGNSCESIWTQNVNCSMVLHHRPTQHYITALHPWALTSPQPVVATKSISGFLPEWCQQPQPFKLLFSESSMQTSKYITTPAFNIRYSLVWQFCVCVCVLYRDFILLGRDKYKANFALSHVWGKLAALIFKHLWWYRYRPKQNSLAKFTFCWPPWRKSMHRVQSQLLF